MKKCPFCSKYLVSQQAVICIHCGRNVITGEAIPVTAPSKKTPVSTPPKISPAIRPPKASSNSPASEKSPCGSGRKIFYMITLTCAIVLVISACVYGFMTYSSYKTQNAESIQTPGKTVITNADSKENTGLAANAVIPPVSVSSAPLKPALAGNAAEPKETIDEAAAETLLKTIINYCYANVHASLLKTGSRDVSVSIAGNIVFNRDKEQPLRLKIYRSSAKTGKYSLIYNDIRSNIQKPKISASQAQPVTTKETRVIYGVSATVTRTTSVATMAASLNFNVIDAVAMECGSNNVYYKIKLYSDSGVPLIESTPMRAAMIPQPVVAGNLKSWSWTPFFPGKDPLDGVLQNGQTAISVSNVEIKGELATALPSQKRFNPPVFFKPGQSMQSSWQYTRSKLASTGTAPDAAEIRPVFDHNRYFEIKGPVELKSLKIDGRKVSTLPDINISTRTIRKVTLNYPGTPVAELEFVYGGKSDTLRVQLPPVPTGLRAELLDDGSVKLTWDALAGRIDSKQFPASPEVRLFRDKKLIHSCDVSQTEFIDRQPEPGRIHAYSMALDDANAKVQIWTKENGVSSTKTMVRNLGNPYPESSKAIVYIYPEKPDTRPVRVSFWEPALCYERTGNAAMQLFSAAVLRLGREADFEVLDRTGRTNLIEEKILTMSYEKSIMIQTLPANFAVLVRDYSRQQGNGVELWLIQNKAFDYKSIKSSDEWLLSSSLDDHFSAWRIGSIAVGDMNIPEKAREFGGKLAEEIRRRVYFKSEPAHRAASVPSKFVFTPLKAVRQQSMVVDDKAIGESIMVGLSNIMSGVSIMTRDDWKNVFGERELMREQGETLDSDIRGNVLVSGHVWLEDGKKQYLFTLSDVGNGICLGAVKSSGTVEEVTAQLADACKKIRLAVPAVKELNKHTKHELDRERWKIFDCFLKRFGQRNAENLYKSLSGQPEISKAEFAEKQWQLGNRKNAVRIMEQIWKTGDKSCWRRLNGYFCKMGNYTRALQTVEAMMQQKKPSIELIPEYYRLRALIAANAPPEICATVNPAEESNASSEFAPDQAMIANHDNNNLEKDYFDRLLAWGMEWNPGGECRSMIKRQVCDGRKLKQWSQENTVSSRGVLIKIVENREGGGEQDGRTWRSEALWESAPLFGGNDSMALAAFVKMAGNTVNIPEILEQGDINKIEHEPFSRIRAYLAIAKNPEVKFVPVEKKFAPYNSNDNVSGHGSKIYGEEREINKEAAECDSGRKYMELRLKRIIKERQEKYGKIKLADMICISIMAKLGNSAAEELLSEIDTIELPPSFEKLHNLQTKYEPYDLLAFKVYRGDRSACELALKSLSTGRCCLGFRDYMADIYYLMAKAGRKEIITAMLSNDECKDKESIAAIRWGDPKILKSLLLEHPELFELDLYFYLLDGLNDPDFRDCMFNRQMLLQTCSDYWIKYVLWLGKPLPEFYREQTLNYKRSE